MTLLEERVRRDRARLRLRTAAAAAAAVVVLVLLVVAGMVNAARDDAAVGGSATLGPAPAGDAASGPAPVGGWDAAAESELAAAPMLALPASAAAPQPLDSAPAPAPIALPTPTRRGALIDEGFGPTPAGAVAQLAALDTAALRDLDPSVYAPSYRSISLPGAPDPTSTQAGQVIATLNSSVDTSSTPIVARWQLTSAQIKGVTDGGRQVVVCVLGELQATAANTVRTGAGDCQSLRYTGTDWRIAPGPAPAPAPAAWPGSATAARAGYRPILGGPA